MIILIQSIAVITFFTAIIFVILAIDKRERLLQRKDELKMLYNLENCKEKKQEYIKEITSIDNEVY